MQVSMSQEYVLQAQAFQKLQIVVWRSSGNINLQMINSEGTWDTEQLTSSRLKIVPKDIRPFADTQLPPKRRISQSHV